MVTQNPMQQITKGKDNLNQTTARLEYSLEEAILLSSQPLEGFEISHVSRGLFLVVGLRVFVGLLIFLFICISSLSLSDYASLFNMNMIFFH